MPPTVHDVGLVLSGGAARGAYQAGVLRFLFRTLPKKLGVVPWPKVVSGTSVGALNGVFLVPRSPAYMVYLSRVWQRMRIPDIYSVKGRDVLSSLTGLGGGNVSAMLDPSPLHRLVQGLFPHEGIRASIDTGAMRAFILSATALQTGLNTLFLDTASQSLDLDPLPGTQVRRTHMRPEHLLASSALPFLFPPTNVDGDKYVDGGLRQNTPLRPVLHSGVDRVLVISPHSPKELLGVDRPEKVIEEHHEVVPTLAFLAGKSLNALMADPVDRDLAAAEKTNRLIEWGVRTYGPGFADQIRQDLGLRHIRILTLRPQIDLGAVANATYRAHPPPDVPHLRWLLNLLVDRANEAGGESDLLSYLYFDREFTARIEAQGHADAKANEEQLVRFLTED